MKQQSNNMVMQYVMIGLLMVGSYMVGVYKTKADYLDAKTNKDEVVKQQAQAPEEKTELTADEWKKIQENPIHTFGDDSAKVTIVEFTDYQCPFCARYVSDAYAQIKKDYVETGKVRYMLHDLPLSFHSHSKESAISARCAEQQGKFAEMHDKMFASQEEWEEVKDVKSVFVGYAKEMGMDTTKFASCMDDENVAKAVADDADLASEIGANGTPTFYINGKALVGAQPYQAFKAMIDAEL